MKPIETTYAGCRFRSRLEARWAVFFDTLGVTWTYEPQGYEVTDGHREPIRYLPDFFLPGLGLWVEVKGEMTVDELETACVASYDERGGLPVDLAGTPADDTRRNRDRILILTDVPRVTRSRVPVHRVTHFHKGAVYLNPAIWAASGQLQALDTPPHQCPLHDDSGGTWTTPCPLCARDGRARSPELTVRALNSGESIPGETPGHVAHAYATARSARFEHADRRIW